MIRPNVPLIGLNGFKGVGKDTVGNHLQNFYGFEKRAFAAKLKEAVANLFDVTVEDVDEWKSTDPPMYVHIRREHRTPEEILIPHVRMDWRSFLQKFGTEMGRKTFGKDFWVNLAMSEPFYKPTVFTDVRFPNEMNAIMEAGGTIVQILRPEYPSDGHASEQPLDPSIPRYVLHNGGNEMELYFAVQEMMDELYGVEAQDE